MAGNGIDEEIHERELEETSKASTSFDQWEVQSVEGQNSKPNPPAYGYDSSQGLSKSFRITIIMGSVLLMIAVILALAVFLPHGANSSKKNNNDRNVMEINESEIRDLACQATQFPQACKSSLSMRMRRNRVLAGAYGVITAAMDLSSDGATRSREFISERQLSTGNLNLAATTQNCLELLEASIGWIARSKAIPLEKRNEDIRAWLGAAVTYQNDCNLALQQANATGIFARSALEQINWGTILTANALSLVDALDAYGPDATSWRPLRTQERNSTVEISSRLIPKQMEEFLLQVPTAGEIIPNLTVSKDGSSLYSSIQDAVDSAPDDCSHARFVIHIKHGLYEEIVRIPRNKINIMLIGDGADRTFITGTRTEQDPGGSAYGSATVGVNGNGFVARDIAFENRAGAQRNLAVALRVDGDLSAFQNCAILGNHGTLYAHSLRQVYRDCRIEGTTDLIFGNSASIFQNCTIFVRRRTGHGETDAARARGRTGPAQSTGFVFRNCTVL